MSDQPAGPPPKGPGAGAWLGSMWLYTVLRFGLFFALWGVLVLVGLSGLLAAVIAAVLSFPLSYVLLAAPRRRLAATVEQRIEAQRSRRAALDAELSGERPEDREF